MPIKKLGEEIIRAEALKVIRSTAKSVGLTFKRQNATINDRQAYLFTDRITGTRKLENCTFWTAYENCVCGYIERYNSTNGSFDK